MAEVSSSLSKETSLVSLTESSSSSTPCNTVTESNVSVKEPSDESVLMSKSSSDTRLNVSSQDKAEGKEVKTTSSATSTDDLDQGGEDHGIDTETSPNKSAKVPHVINIKTERDSDIDPGEDTLASASTTVTKIEQKTLTVTDGKGIKKVVPLTLLPISNTQKGHIFVQKQKNTVVSAAPVVKKVRVLKGNETQVELPVKTYMKDGQMFMNVQSEETTTKTGGATAKLVPLVRDQGVKTSNIRLVKPNLIPTTKNKIVSSSCASTFPGKMLTLKQGEGNLAPLAGSGRKTVLIRQELPKKTLNIRHVQNKAVTVKPFMPITLQKSTGAVRAEKFDGTVTKTTEFSSSGKVVNLKDTGGGGPVQTIYVYPQNPLTVPMATNQVKFVKKKPVKKGYTPVKPHSVREDFVGEDREGHTTSNGYSLRKRTHSYKTRSRSSSYCEEEEKEEEEEFGTAGSKKRKGNSNPDYKLSGCNHENKHQPDRLGVSSNIGMQKEDCMNTSQQTTEKPVNNTISNLPLVKVKEEPVSEDEHSDKEIDDSSKLLVEKGDDEESDLLMEVETEAERNRRNVCLNQRGRDGRFLSKNKYDRIKRFKEMIERRKRQEEKNDGQTEEVSPEERSKVTEECFYCKKQHSKGQCKKTPKAIKNRAADCPNSNIKAIVSLPVELSLSFSEKTHGLGVFTTEDLPRGCVLGPVEGERKGFGDMSTDMNLTHIWVIEHKDFLKREEKPEDRNYMCTKDEMSSNWCRYLRATTWYGNSNVSCDFELEDSQIYFRANRCIEAGEELVFYLPGNDNVDMKENLDNRTCKRCEITFQNSVLCLKHCKIFHTFHLRHLKSQCKFCFAILSSAKLLTDHCRKEHSGLGAFNCPDCGKSFVERKAMLNHQQLVHEVKGKFECKECGLTYKNTRQLHLHRRRRHTGKTYTCETCGKKFTSQGVWSRHKAIHTSDYKCTCEVCGKQFREAGCVKVHMLTHSKVKPFRCSEPGCNVGYTTKQCLQIHYRKAHSYMDDTMPEIKRVVPYTMEAHSQKADAGEEVHGEDSSNYKKVTCHASTESNPTEEISMGQRHNSGVEGFQKKRATSNERDIDRGLKRSKDNAEDLHVDNGNSAQSRPQTRYMKTNLSYPSPEPRHPYNNVTDEGYSNTVCPPSYTGGHSVSHAPAAMGVPPYGFHPGNNLYNSSPLNQYGSQSNIPNVSPSLDTNVQGDMSRVMQLTEL